MFFAVCKKGEDLEESNAHTISNRAESNAQFESNASQFSSGLSPDSSIPLTPDFSLYGTGPRLSIIPTLPSNEPLELLALTNEAILDRNALLACKRISELSRDTSSNWMREQVAQCLARAYLLLGNVFPLASRFPPVDSFFTFISAEEAVIVAVIVEDNKKSELLSKFDETPVDGLESYPVTFYRSQPPSSCSREFHAELVMLSSVEEKETLHLTDNRGSNSQSLASALSASTSIRRNNKPGRTYFARRLYKRIVVVVCFPKSLRDANDAAVIPFLERLERLFIL
jgi:hypothetical protein